MARDEWTALPPLNVPRTQHTACVVGSRSFYVFCGKKQTFMGEYPTNEIEFLESKNSPSWEVITTSNQFSPRTECGAIETDNYELLIFGGVNKDGTPLMDAFVMNTITQTISLSSRDTGKELNLR